MLRVFCSTNYCGLLDAQHCRDRQAIATLEGERDAAIAQAAALAADNAKLRRNWTRRGRGRRSTWGCTAMLPPQRRTPSQRQKIGGRRGASGARILNYIKRPTHAKNTAATGAKWANRAL